MPQFRNVPRTVHAEQFDGTQSSIDVIAKLGATIELDSTGQHRIDIEPAIGTHVDIYPGDWVVKVLNGFSLVDEATFATEYVGARPDDTQAVSFKLNTTDGETVTATIEGWKTGRAAVYTLMHIGRPEVVLEFVKEQVAAGDMSMMTLMNEMAAKANPGE